MNALEDFADGIRRAVFSDVAVDGKVGDGLGLVCSGLSQGGDRLLPARSLKLLSGYWACNGPVSRCSKVLDFRLCRAIW